MKSHRFRTEYRAKASKLHKVVGDILRDPTGYFAGHRVYQEYPVSKVNPSCENNRLHFDWVDLDLRLVVECHGEQHYKPQSFGGGDSDFVALQERDYTKMQYAISAGYTYIVIPYYLQGSVTGRYLWDLYLEKHNDLPIEKPSKNIESEYKLKEKERAREYRKQRYLKVKELKGRLKDGTQNDRHSKYYTKT